MSFPSLRIIALALAVALVGPSSAQQQPPDDAAARDANTVNEQALLQQESRIEGRINIPDRRAAVLIQPAGRRWDYFHETTLHRTGAIVILGMIVLLGLAFFILGPTRISAGRSGKTITRFSPLERFSHWLTAVSFVVLGLTGLNITFGKIVLLPIMGESAFSGLALFAKYVHNFVSFAFIVGLTLIGTLWMKDNFPRQVDIDWVKQGGGFVKNKHAPAGRFNAGEKGVFWLSLAAGAAVSVSGLLLLFPFYGTNIATMQIAVVVHAIIAVLFFALILAHAYMGTLGMEGAFEAMETGEVDVNWAKEHHDVWFVEKQKQEGLGS